MLRLFQAFDVSLNKGTNVTFYIPVVTQSLCKIYKELKVVVVITDSIEKAESIVKNHYNNHGRIGFVHTTKEAAMAAGKRM